MTEPACQKGYDLVLSHGITHLTEMEQFFAHAETCEACRQALAQSQKVQEMFSSASVSSAEPQHGWDAFQQNLKAQKPVRKAPFGLLAMAACMLLGLLLGHISSKPAPGVPGSPFKALSVREAQNQTQVFDGVSQCLDQKVGWILVSNTQTHQGLLDQPTLPGQKTWVVRLMLTQGDKLVQSSDLVILGGQKANWALPLSATQKLNMALDTSGSSCQVAAALESEQFSKQKSPAFTAYLPMQSGKLQHAGHVRTPSGNYELLVSMHQAGKKEVF